MKGIPLNLTPKEAADRLRVYNQSMSGQLQYQGKGLPRRPSQGLPDEWADKSDEYDEPELETEN